MSPIKATGWLRERGSWVKSASRLQRPPPPTHPPRHTLKHTHSFAQRITRAACSLLVKGRVGLAGTQSLCICIIEGAESGGARETDWVKKKTSIRSAWTFLFLDIILSISLTFLGLSICPSRWPDFSCDSAERKRAKQGEKAGQISGEETSLYAERRTSLRASGVRLCAVGTQDRTGLPCSSPPA